jgi:hypothetical protein
MTQCFPPLAQMSRESIFCVACASGYGMLGLNFGYSEIPPLITEEVRGMNESYIRQGRLMKQYLLLNLEEMELFCRCQTRGLE